MRLRVSTPILLGLALVGCYGAHGLADSPTDAGRPEPEVDVDASAPVPEMRCAPTCDGPECGPQFPWILDSPPALVASAGGIAFAARPDADDALNLGSAVSVGDGELVVGELTGSGRLRWVTSVDGELYPGADPAALPEGPAILIGGPVTRGDERIVDASGPHLVAFDHAGCVRWTVAVGTERPSVGRLAASEDAVVVAQGTGAGRVRMVRVSSTGVVDEWESPPGMDHPLRVAARDDRACVLGGDRPGSEGARDLAITCYRGARPAWSAVFPATVAGAEIDARGGLVVVGGATERSLDFGGGPLFERAHRMGAFIVRFRPDGAHDFSRTLSSVTPDGRVRLTASGGLAVDGQHNYVSYAENDEPEAPRTLHLVRGRGSEIEARASLTSDDLAFALEPVLAPGGGLYLSVQFRGGLVGLGHSLRSAEALAPQWAVLRVGEADLAP